MTKQQFSRMGKASQKVQALKRLAAGDRADIPIRSGLQLSCIIIDFRRKEPVETNYLLFDAGKQNRYRWMKNMQKQDGLIGWTNTMRMATKNVRPLLNI